ncbi:transcription elongation factor NusA [Candidatus Micrarchaeota archaeon]|nr:transcription elongation factor NusA [Candidatus Micrarchaeota archaeon]
MKSPICETCIKADILCSGCEARLASGQVSETDLQVARELYEMEKEGKADKPTFDKTVTVDGLVIIQTSGRVADLVGKGGKLVKDLSERLGKKVRVVSKGDAKSTISDLVYPVRLRGVNKVFTTKGDHTKIILDKKDMKKVSMSEETLRRAIKQLLGVEAQVGFD